jgi:hypothetical protein
MKKGSLSLPDLEEVPTHLFVAFTNPAPGREDEYNEWYSGEHLAAALDCQGFRRAQRFEAIESDRATASLSPYRYATLYDMVTDDLKASFDGMHRRVLGEEEGMRIPVELLGSPSTSWAFNAGHPRERPSVRRDDVVMLDFLESPGRNLTEALNPDTGAWPYTCASEQIARRNPDLGPNAPPAAVVLWMTSDGDSEWKRNGFPPPSYRWSYRPVTDAVTS